MALDAKAIKEEIPDKDTYETSTRKVKAGKEQCRTPDSPEGARVVAPRSPISPQIHHNSLVPPRTSLNRNGSTSPIINGSLGSLTPPPPVTPAQQDTAKLLKIRRFLGALVQFGQDTNVDIGDRVRSLVLSLASGGLSVDEFQIAVQEATNFPLRSNVVPFLKTHVPVLLREINILSRTNKQSPLQYVRTNENSVMEYVQNLADTADIFLPNEGSFTSTNNTVNGIALKRRASENIYEGHSNGPQEWNDYVLPPTKRPHHSMLMTSTAPQMYSAHPTMFEYQNGIHSHSDPMHSNHRDERDLRTTSSETHRANRNPTGGSSGAGSGGSGGDEEWKNIHTMLTCISAMVEKTKRAISILQQRGIETHISHQDNSIADIKRQTEDKIAEFRRNAEESVNQVKRQAVMEIQRAVAAAEARTLEMIAQERIKMEKVYADLHRNNNDPVVETESQSSTGSQNACWNCGRKANETCSGCNLARYCGSFCQHKDWEQHHQVCGTTRAENNIQKHAQNTRPITSRSSTPQQSQNSTPNGVTSGVK